MTNAPAAGSPATGTSTHHTSSPAPRHHALVVGLGISGIASAISLHQAGWQVTVAERASGRRRGGYFIGLFGLGRNAAAHLGALDNLHDRRGPDSENLEIDRAGVVGDTLGFADAPADTGPWMMLRGDVEQATFDALPEEVEIRFDTHPTRILQEVDAAHVTLENTKTGQSVEESYDLVVGADGNRSSVRQMVFGPHERYLKPLGDMICAFELPENPPGLRPDQGVIMTEIGRSMWVFPFKDHPATVLFTYRSDDPQAERKKDPRQAIREEFGPEPYGQYMDYALSVLDTAEDFIFDTTEQVHMPHWHQGRVVLVGDAAWCPTLYSGMGATSGIGGADLLGHCIAKNPDDIGAALDTWESTLRPYIKNFQDAGITGRTNFVVHTEAEKKKRTRRVNTMRRLLKNPVTNKILAKTPMMKPRNVDLTSLV
jgi:2-polyprenyl-6-methoxyphenol hydroxylase-like FAD-dependent oxidoreductase